MKRTSRYYWDFEGLHVLVMTEADEALAHFPYVGDADIAIAKAEQLIADLNAGRVSEKQLRKN